MAQKYSQICEPSVHNYWDRGLLGMALDPNFPASPYIYVHYTFNAPLDGSPFPAWSTIDGTNDNGPGTGGQGPPVSSRLARLTVGPGNTWDGNELVLISDWPSQYPSHAVGSVEFGPDGALYVSAGTVPVSPSPTMGNTTTSSAAMP